LTRESDVRTTTSLWLDQPIMNRHWAANNLTQDSSKRPWSPAAFHVTIWSQETRSRLSTVSRRWPRSLRREADDTIEPS